MIDMDKAVAVYLDAGTYQRKIREAITLPSDKRKIERQRLKLERDCLYAEADRLAGSHKALLAELTKRKIISWVF